jgi:hypothetical protein
VSRTFLRAAKSFDSRVAKGAKENMKTYYVGLLLVGLTTILQSATSFLRNPVGKNGISLQNHVLYSSSASTQTSAELKDRLLSLIASTERGQRDHNYQSIYSAIDDLAGTFRKPSASVADIPEFTGEWELIYADDDITRSSPFFWAFRKALAGVEDPVKLLGTTMLSESLFKFTDNVPFKSIGTATQFVTKSENGGRGDSKGTLSSRVEVKILPVGQSLMCTTCTWRKTEESDLIEIDVDKTEVQDSTLFQGLAGQLLPKPLLDRMTSFPSGAALELVKYVLK